MKTSKLTHDFLTQVLDYNAETGVFLWKVATSPRVSVGQEAGAISSGRRYIAVLGEKVLAHRLAWFYVTKEWPSGNVAPIDGNHGNVAFSNLKVETLSETARRAKVRTTNRSGHRGVSWSASKGRWQSVIGRDGRRIHLGYFGDATAAAAAYEAAAAELPEEGGTKTEWNEVRRRRHVMRIVWNRITRETNGHNPWPSFETFLLDVPTAPSVHHTLGAADASRAFGRDNFAWLEPAAKRTWKAPRDYHRARDLDRSFGISTEEYEAMRAAQNGLCAICEQPERQMRGGTLKRLAVDHDHKTDAVRALLCSECNQGLGKFGDSVELLSKAIAYLRRHSGAGTVVPLTVVGETS